MTPLGSFVTSLIDDVISCSDRKNVVMWRQKMTSYDVIEWRHDIGSTCNLPKMFVSLISRIHKLPLVISGCELNTQRRDNREICAGEKRGWTFVGYGRPDKQYEFIYKEKTTVTQCLDLCINKRKTDGNIWNGMRWSTTTGWCVCYDYDTGHEYIKNILHFRVDE